MSISKCFSFCENEKINSSTNMEIKNLAVHGESKYAVATVEKLKRIGRFGKNFADSLAW